MSVETIESDLRRSLKVRMRPDLVVTKQRHAGQSFFVLKDPVSLRYFRFRPEEYFLLEHLDGKRTLEDVRAAFADEFRPQRLSGEEIEQFVRQLLHAGVATVDSAHVGRRLYERHVKRRRDKLKQTLASFMYIKIPLFDPERMLEGMLKYLGFLFTLPFFIFALCFWASAGILILVNWDRFLAKLPSFEEFFHLQNIIWMWLAIGVVKVLHEFGHGLACKKFGGEVHEMGFMLLVFSPALYCNVTDAWMLPNRWHRAAIGAAGIYIELLISAAAAWVWWFSEPGMLNFLCLSTITVCSVSTVVFNGNPLMKFDGYYILSDLMEVPNLRERSNKFLGNTVGRALFGVEVVPDAYAPARGRWGFAAYAVAAYLYKWVVAIGILIFFHTFLKPYKLEIIGSMLAWMTVAGMLVWPTIQIFQTLRRRWREMKVKTARMVLGLSVAGLLLAGFLLTPLPLRLDVPMVLQPRGATTLYVQAAGRLAELRIKDGDPVAPGMILAVLENLELTKEQAKLELEAATLLRRRQASVSIGDHAAAAVAEVEYQSVRDRLRQMETEHDKLILRAPPDARGYCIAPPRDVDLGRWLEHGKPFCRIGLPRELEAFAVVEHADTSLFKLGDRVWIKVHGHVGAIHQSRIEKISEAAIEDLPAALSSKAGGAVAAAPQKESKDRDPSRSGEALDAPLLRSFSLAAPLDDDDLRLAIGLRGSVRVDCGNATLFWRLKRYLQQTFYFKI